MRPPPTPPVAGAVVEPHTFGLFNLRQKEDNRIIYKLEISVKQKSPVKPPTTVGQNAAYHSCDSFVSSVSGISLSSFVSESSRR